MKSKRLLLFCCTCIFFLFVYTYAQRTDVKNNPPKVEILTPVNASSFDWNSFIRYSIRVTDAEDGSSEYQEISSKEVFLEITYLPGNSKLNEINTVKASITADPPGFALMKTSTCFNCHTVKAKLVGPPFFEISRKYPHNSATIDMLAKRVIEGSSGFWTNTVMPPNPDITLEQSKQVIQWILENAGDVNRNLYVGTEGTFKTRDKPENAKGSYILTASYTDHGLKGMPKSNQRGQHRIVLYNK